MYQLSYLHEILDFSSLEIAFQIVPKGDNNAHTYRKLRKVNFIQFK